MKAKSALKKNEKNKEIFVYGIRETLSLTFFLYFNCFGIILFGNYY